MGRRMPGEDVRQIKRWKAMKRHVSQVRKHCEPGDPMCRPRQRQALLALGLRQPDHVNDALAIQMSLGTLNDAKPAPAADSARRQR